MLMAHFMILNVLDLRDARGYNPLVFVWAGL